MNDLNYRIIVGKGCFGNVFEFGKKSNMVIFFKSKDNIVYNF